MTAFLLMAAFGGCVSSSGLLFRPGPHKLLETAESFADAAGNAAEIPSELAKAPQPDYRVEPGDVLAIDINDPNSTLRLPGDVAVQPNGTIRLGPLGNLVVIDQTLDEIELGVQELLAQRTGPKKGKTDKPESSVPPEESPVSVRVVEYRSKVFYVLGEVSAPGSYPLEGRETVLDAIIKGGGLTDRANRHRIILSRPTPPESCRVVLPICYRHIVQLGDTSTNYQLEPGDRVFVASITFLEELCQTVWPYGGEVCPHCKERQVPCPVPGFTEVGSRPKLLD